MPDLLFIVFLALVVFGPKRLPEIAGQVGKYLAQFKRVQREFVNQISGEMLALERDKSIRQEPTNQDHVMQPAANIELEGPSSRSR